jgi:hypothetical protein
LVRVSDVAVAGGLAGLATITLCAWTLYGRAPAEAESRVAQAAATTDVPRQAPAAKVSFDQRFLFDASAPAGRAISFDERFGIATATPPATDTATAPAEARAPRPAASGPAARATRSVLAQGDVDRAPAQYRLASLEPPLRTAYAPANRATKESPITAVLRTPAPRDTGSDADATPSDGTTKDANPLAVDPSHTAIYDISARTVYLPSGQRLEAHSGLGASMDDVHSVNLKSRGPTPPNTYDLSLREAPFHGVRAIRLTPVDGSAMYGRDGILAHPFMLGPDGGSNGCVSVKDYQAFLDAYLRGEITRIVVVEQLDNPPGTIADWFSDRLKRIFGRS